MQLVGLPCLRSPRWCPEKHPAQRDV